MNAWLEQVFSNVKNMFAAFSLRSVLSIVLVAVVVLLTTACSPNSPSASGTGSYFEKKGQNTNLYEEMQPRKGGMNQYEDVDPRR